MDKVRVAIVGSEFAAGLHARAMKRNPHALIVAACSIDAPSLARFVKNYDVPDAYELDRFVQDLAALRQGRAIAAPQYDFTIHDRASVTRPVKPAPVIVVEGLFLFHDPRARELFDLRLFVDAADDTRFQRRLQRDQSCRGRSAEEVHKRFHEHAQPGHEQYIEPTRQYADLIVLNNSAGLQLPRGLEVVVGWLQQRCMP